VIFWILIQVVVPDIDQNDVVASSEAISFHATSKACESARARHSPEKEAIDGAGKACVRVAR
jgi:hypothetical protein